MKFIYVLEGKIGRLEIGVSPNDIGGLCTDEFTSCNILVLISKDLTRYVLIHADSSLTETHIENQLKWVGEDASKQIYRRVSFVPGQQPSDVLNRIMSPRLQKIFDKAVIVPENLEVVQIKLGHGKAEFLKTLSSNVEFHTQSALLTAQHRAEGQYARQVQLNRQVSKYAHALVYDIDKWTTYEDMTVSSAILDIWKSKRIHKGMCAFYLHDTINRENSTLSMVWQLGKTAAMFSYFYLTSGLPFNRQTFLDRSYNLFENDLFTNPHFNPNKNAKVQEFLTECRKAINHQDLVERAAHFNKHTEIDEYTRDVINNHNIILANAYILLFVKYVSVNAPTLSNLNLQTYNQEELRKVLSAITPGRTWGVSQSKPLIWLELNSIEEAESIKAHFIKNGYVDVSLATRLDNEKSVLKISNIDLKKLQNIPPINKKLTPAEEYANSITIGI